MISNVAQHKSKNGVLAPYWDSALIEKSASGAVASFSDGGDGMPMVSVVADIDAVQDLHGQESPYPSGGGKNKFNATGTSEYLSFSNGVYTLTSLPPANKSVSLGTVSLKGGESYILSGGVSNAFRLFVNVDGTNYLSGTSQSSVFTPSTDMSLVVYCVIETTATVNTKIYPMVRLSSVTDATFAPYSNICPISGWDSVNVTRTGKNLFDIKSWLTSIGISYTESNGYIQFYAVTAAYTNLFNLPSGVEKYVSMEFGANTTAENTRMRVKYADGTYNNNVHPTSPDSVKHGDIIGVAFNWSSIGLIEVKASVEVGSTASEYMPYVAQTYPTTLPQTVYGGTLDVVSGVLTITHGIVNLGTLTYSKSSIITNGFVATGGMPSDFPLAPNSTTFPNWKCSQYTIYSNVGLEQPGVVEGIAWRISGQNKGVIIRDNQYADYYTNNDMASFKSAMSGVQLVYELATPQTIQLTPQEVDSLLADNNVWADSGNVSVVYRADSTLAYNQLTNAIVSLGGNI